MAGRAAIDKAGIDPSKIGILISTSVCKENLEPSVACAVHHQLGLSTSCLNFDIANACLGFINAMHLAATMLDAGTVEYALIVDGEGVCLTPRVDEEGQSVGGGVDPCPSPGGSCSSVDAPISVVGCCRLGVSG